MKIATRIRVLFAGAIALLLVAVPAFAIDADTTAKFQAARNAGMIGETASGYAEFVQASSDVELRRVLNEVNAFRRAAYTEIAQKNGQSVDVAGQVAAAGIIERLSAGSYVKDDTGAWKRK